VHSSTKTLAEHRWVQVAQLQPTAYTRYPIAGSFSLPRSNTSSRTADHRLLNHFLENVRALQIWVSHAQAECSGVSQAITTSLDVSGHRRNIQPRAGTFAEGGAYGDRCYPAAATIQQQSRQQHGVQRRHLAPGPRRARWSPTLCSRCTARRRRPST
jgi:hypothetical protein